MPYKEVHTLGDQMAYEAMEQMKGSPLITAAIVKPADETTGLYLYKSKFDDSLIITKMAASSKFWLTPLCVGMTIISINNADATRLTENSAQILMQTSSKINILARFPNEMFLPGSLVTAVAKKELKDTRVGVALNDEDGKVVIDEIVGNSLAEETNLKKGMEMLRIENVECANKRQSADLLRMKTGTLTMLARIPGPPQATAYHVTCTIPSIPSKRDKVVLIGLDLVQEKNGSIYITDIDKNSPFRDSKLRVGMELLKINNIKPRTLADAQALLEKACDYLCLTILAQQGCRAPPGTLVTATVTKAMSDQTLGVLLGMNEAGQVVVKRIQDNSLISRTNLEPGMIVHSVGNIPTRGRHNTQASEIMAATERYVTLLAEAPTSEGKCPTRPFVIASLFMATFYKRLKDMNVGLKVARRNGRMVVAQLEDGGLAAATGLRVGMTVMKINDEDCTAVSVEDATALFTERDGIVTILAHQDPPIRQLITASFEKTKDSKVGIRLRAFKGTVAITYIVKDTLAAGTDLLGGMVFKSINNIDCISKEPEEVARMLKEGEGTVTILAATPDCKAHTAALVTATIPPQEDGVEKDIFFYEDGKLMVSEWGAKGIFFGSALRTGMEVLSLNNVDHEVFSMAGVLKFFEEATITILAKRPPLPSGLLVAEVMQKDSPDEPVGLRFEETDGRLMISSIDDGTVAAKSKLMVGMQVYMINNATCVGLSPDRAMELVADGLIDVIVVAGTPAGNATKRRLVVATIDKSKDVPVGLTLSRQNGKLTISKISDESLAADSDLDEGMEFLSLNNIDCTSKTPTEVDALFSMGDSFTVLAERHQNPPGTYVTASIYKNSADTVLGVTMLQRGGNVYFKYINPDGPAGETDLHPGMQILAINNMSCIGMTVKQVVMHLRAAQGLKPILAQTTNEKFEEVEEEADAGSLNDSDVTIEFDPEEDGEGKEEENKAADGTTPDDESNGGSSQGFDAEDAAAWD